MGNKSNGLGAAKKIRRSRRTSRWMDKSYKVKTLGLRVKSDPLAGSSQAKAIVLEKKQLLASHSLLIGFLHTFS